MGAVAGCRSVAPGMSYPPADIPDASERQQPAGELKPPLEGQRKRNLVGISTETTWRRSVEAGAKRISV